MPDSRVALQCGSPRFLVVGGQGTYSLGQVRIGMARTAVKVATAALIQGHVLGAVEPLEVGVGAMERVPGDSGHRKLPRRGHPRRPARGHGSAHSRPSTPTRQPAATHIGAPFPFAPNGAWTGHASVTVLGTTGSLVPVELRRKPCPTGNLLLR